MDHRDLQRPLEVEDEDTSARSPWTGTDLAQAPTVQMGMFLLLVLLALIVLWITWSLIAAG